MAIDLKVKSPKKTEPREKKILENKIVNSIDHQIDT